MTWPDSPNCTKWMEEQKNSIDWVQLSQNRGLNSLLGQGQLEVHLAVDHFLPDEFLEKLTKELPPGLTDALAGGQQVHHDWVQPGQQ